MKDRSDATTAVLETRFSDGEDLTVTLRPGNAGTEVSVQVGALGDQTRARQVLDWIKAVRAGVEDGEEAADRAGDDRGGVEWKDVAIFYRTNALSRVMEDTLRGAGVPYVIARGTAFYEREEVKDALAYLRVVANPADEVSLQRVINKPARGIGASTAAQIEGSAAERGMASADRRSSRRICEGAERLSVVSASCRRFSAGDRNRASTTISSRAA